MKRLLFGLFVIIGALMLINNDALGQSMAGVISVDSISAQRGDQIAVPVQLEGNTYDIAGLFVPVKYPASVLQFDSVSFIGSFITPDYTGFYNTDLIEGAVAISFILSNYINPSPMNSPNGIIGTLYLTVKDDAAPGEFPLDSVNQVEDLGVGVIEKNVQMSDPSGMVTYYPDFVEGAVAVLVPTSIEDDINTGLPSSFSLSQNYPNPFNPTTTIEFALPKSGSVKLEVFNVLGQKVETLADGFFQAGHHQVEFNAKKRPSGVFFYRLTHSEGVETKKMLLVK